jgi:hypothetical protein
MHCIARFSGITFLIGCCVLALPTAATAQTAPETAAATIGLKIPSGHLVYPEVYINSLRELNRGGQEVANVPYVQWGMRPPAASPAGRL